MTIEASRVEMPRTGEPGARSGRPSLSGLEVDIRLLGMVIALVVLWVTFNFLSDGLFLTPRFLWNLSVQSAAVAVMTTGMVLIIVSRNIDLSVGSILGFTAMVMGAAPGGVDPQRPGRRPERARHLDHRRHRRDRAWRAHRRAPGIRGRVRRCPVVRRDPRGTAHLAGCCVCAGERQDDRPARPHVPAPRRRAERVTRRDPELARRGPRDRRHRLRPRRQPAPPAPIRLSGPPDVGRCHDRGARQRPCRGRRLDRERLPMATGPRRAIRDRERDHDSARRTHHPGRDRESRSSSRSASPVWPSRVATTVRTLRLRHRWQPGGRGAGRHQHPAARS